MADQFRERLVKFVDENREWLRERVQEWLEEHRAACDATRDARESVPRPTSAADLEKWEWENREGLEAQKRFPKSPLPPPDPAVGLSMAAKCAGLAAFHDACCDRAGVIQEKQVLPIQGVTVPRDPSESVKDWQSRETRLWPYESCLNNAMEALGNDVSWDDALDGWLVNLCPPQPTSPTDPSGKQTPAIGIKRSTESGEAREKLIAALTKHHKYADDSALNTEPIGSNRLAVLAEVSKSTASTFFKDEFGGHRKYKIACRNSSDLIASLKLLNQELSPHLLLGGMPSDRLDRDE